MITLAIANQKGGIGKTTTAQALAGAYRKQGAKVLLIDLDYQSNLTFTENKPCLSAYQVFMQGTGITGDFIGSNEYTVMLQNELKSKDTIKKRLQKVQNDFDFCIIDTPPALNTITVNALFAANVVIIPTSANLYGLQGLKGFKDTIDALGKNKPVIGGIVLTKYSDRTNLAKGFTEEATSLAQALGTKLYKATIPNSVIVEEAQAMKKNLFDYAPNSKPAQAYMSLAEEIRKDLKNGI